MRTTKSLTGDLLEKLQSDARYAAEEREQVQAQNRIRLRDFAVQLREANQPHSFEPASTSSPSFKIGDVKGFNHVSERGETTPGAGHLSQDAYKSFMNHMQDAASKQDVTSRDASVNQAAKVVSKDWANKHGHGHKDPGLLSSVLHEARAQATFKAIEIGQKLGLGPMESAAIGYSLERALEKEGFKVLASHAVDKVGDVFKASSSSIAGSTGMRAAMEANLDKSMNWLASNGVTREAFKDALNKHMGKLMVLNEVAGHPEAVTRAAQLISHSDTAFKAVSALATDSELRKAVGSITLAAGETMAQVHKGIGSAAILAGSTMRGDSMEETGRHAFRAALSVVGGAAGGIAAGTVSAGFGSVAGAVAGSTAGAALADKLMSLYDEYTGRSPAQAGNQTMLAKGELSQSAKVVEQRTGAAAREQGAVMVREMGMAKG